MATYRKRNNKWEYRVRYVDPITGKKKEKSKGGFKTKPEAVYASSQVFIDVKDGVISKNNNILLKDYIGVWWDVYKGTVKETSLKSRKIAIVRIKAWFGQLRLKNLTLNLYQKKLNEEKQNYSKNYLTSINQVMQMIAKQAVEDGYFKTNPIARAKIPHYDDVEKIKFWEYPDVQKFENFYADKLAKKHPASLRHLDYENERDLALYYIMLYGGLRVGEACGLQVKDYYPITKEINVDKTLSSPETNPTKDSYRLYPPKTKNSYRLVPLPEIASKQIERWLKLREEYRNIFGYFEDQEYLFCIRDGSPLTPRTVQYKFKTIVNKLDVPQISPHGLRHTYTSLQIQAGADPKSLQKLLGHGDIKTTLNIYAHITGDKKRETINNFDNMLKKLNGGAKAGQGSFLEISKK